MRGTERFDRLPAAHGRAPGRPVRGRCSPLVLLVRLSAALALALVGLLLAAPAGQAAEVRGEEDVTVAADEVVDDDLYVTAGDVVVDGTVRGDLVVLAGRVTINGTVEGDLIAAAQTVLVEGTVGDDARLAGQVLALGGGARVAGDLVTASYSLQTRPGAAVGGDVLLAGYQALLDGTVEGDVSAGAAGLALAGRIGGNVQADVGGAEDVRPAWVPMTDVAVPGVATGLTLTDTARLGGDLSYRSPSEAAIAPGAEVAGAIAYEPVAADEEPAGPTGALALLLDGLRRLVTLLAVGLLLLWLLPRTVDGAATTLRTRPWSSLGWGALAVAGAVAALFAVLAVAVLLALALGALTLGGLAAAVVGVGLVLDAVLALALALAVGLLGPVVVAFTAGGGMLRDPVPARFGRRVLALALGLLVYVLLRAVPFVGPVVGLLVALFGVGALVVWAWTALSRSRARRAGRAPGRPAPPVPWDAGGRGREVPQP